MKRLVYFGLVMAAGMVMDSRATERGIALEADGGVVTPPFCITNKCLYQAVDSGFTNGGRAVYTFTITNAGDYAILAEVNSPTGTTNAFCVNIDEEPQQPGMIWDMPATSRFTEKAVMWRVSGGPGTSKPTAKYFHLTPGRHQLIIRGISAGFQLRSFRILQGPARPSNLRIITGGS